MVVKFHHFSTPLARSMTGNPSAAPRRKLMRLEENTVSSPGGNSLHRMSYCIEYIVIQYV